MNSRVAVTLAVRGGPERPKAIAEASQVSLSRESFTARHHGLPGAGSDRGSAAPAAAATP